MADPPETSLSMLQGMREDDSQQWDRFVRLFGPLVFSWCRRRDIPEQDAADIVQEVFRGVAGQIASFQKEGPHDTFRGWLRRITQHKIADYFRLLAKGAAPRGGSTANMQMQTVAFDDANAQDDQELEEDTQALYLRALELIEGNFEARTWRAFWQVAVEDKSPEVVARELEMTNGAVYNAKYKVLRRLREEFKDLL